MAKGTTNTLLLVVLSLAVLLCSLCGCKNASPNGENGDTPTDSPNQAADLTFAYTANDSLNPYLAKTKTNQELSCLLYDGLIVLGEGYQPQHRLAREVRIAGTQVIVTLQEAYFSDGSRVTAADVMTSMKASMASETLSYGRDFENVKNITLGETGGLVIELNHEDPYFVNFLDFPVYKSGTESQENEDNKHLPPIGSGRYVYHEEAGSYWLTANPNWIGGAVNIPKIALLNLPDDDAIDHAMHVGTVDWCYSDLRENRFPNMNGTSQNVPLANLVYVGANMTSGMMTNSFLRSAISAAINRTSLTENAYFGVATPAVGVLPSTLKEVEGLQTIAPTAEDEKTETFFAKAGFDQMDDQGTRVNQNGRTLSLKLIYNNENPVRESLANLLAAQLGAAGCKITLQGLPFDAYRSAISRGHYDLYVGEMQIPDNFDLYPLLTAGGLVTYTHSEPTASTGGDSFPEQEDADMGSVEENAESQFVTLRAAWRYHNGKGSLTEMVSCFQQELPIIPICYRAGMLIYADSIEGAPTPLAGDPFHGIELCTVKEQR